MRQTFFLTGQLLLLKDKRRRRRTFTPPTCLCSSLACSALPSLCAPLSLCFRYSTSLLHCKSSTARSSMGETRHSSALRECNMGIASQVLMPSSTIQRKAFSFGNPLSFQLSILPLWEAVWSGDVYISSDLFAAVPLLHFGQRASSWGPILCKQRIMRHERTSGCAIWLNLLTWFTCGLDRRILTVFWSVTGGHCSAHPHSAGVHPSHQCVHPLQESCEAQDSQKVLRGC